MLKLVASTLIVVAPLATKPSPSTIKISVVALVARVVPVPSAIVFQFAAALTKPPVVPTQ